MFSDRSIALPLFLLVVTAGCSSAFAAGTSDRTAGAGASPFDQSTQAAIIAHAKEVKASDLDTSLQAVALDTWVAARARNGTVSWQATNCGPRADDPLLCAEATFKTCSGESAFIAIAIGMLRFGFRDPAIFSDAWIGGDQGKKIFVTLGGIGDAAPVCKDLPYK